MIHIPPQAKIHTIPFPIEDDNGTDDYYIQACRSYGHDPFSGNIYLLKNEEATQLGLLMYDGHGFQWCVKRFSEGSIAWWPCDSTVHPKELQIMLWGGNPNDAKMFY